MAEKLARQAHAARMQAAAPPIAPIAGGDELRDGHANDDAEGATAAPPGFVIDPALATSLGLAEETRRALPGRFGFRALGAPGNAACRERVGQDELVSGGAVS